MIEVSVIGAFLAGLLMFFAPCTLPLIPTFMAYLAGSTERRLLVGEQRQTLLIHTAAYCLGFATVFVSLGILAGHIGALLSTYKTMITQVGGVGIVLVGLVLLGVRIPRFRAAATRGHTAVVANPYTAYGIGFLFAIGWTPCVGPLLATILLLASSAGSVWLGAGLLGVFSLGLAVPFLLTALLYSYVHVYFARSGAVLERVQFVAGLFLCLIGVLLLTNMYEPMIALLYQFYEIVGFSSLYRFF